MLRPEQIARLQARFAGLIVEPTCTLIDSHLGQHCVLSENSEVYNSKLGDRSYLAPGGSLCYADVGSFCSIGPGARVGLANHPTSEFVSTHPIFYTALPARNLDWAPTSRFDGFVETHVGHDVWIGANALLRAGVRVGNGAIIGAGAVVTHDVAPYAVVAGVPARLLRLRFPAEDVAFLTALQWWDFDDAFLREHHASFASIAALRTLLANTTPPRRAADPDAGLPLREFLLEKMPQVHVVSKWKVIGGDYNLRFDFPLNPSDTVIDAGGFQGEWTAGILRRYGCRVHVFEPVAAFARQLQTLFQGDARVQVHAVGLAGRARTEDITLEAEGSSVLRTGPAPRQQIALQAAEEFFRTISGPIALLKINIEGCEYELLEHLLDTGLIRRIRHLLVQFHDFVPDARARRRAIRQRLAATHAQAWNYPFVWEAHHLK